MEFAFYQQFFLIKFNENCSFGGRVVPCGQTGGRADSPEESNGRLSQFCERAYYSWQFLRILPGLHKTLHFVSLIGTHLYYLSYRVQNKQ